MTTEIQGIPRRIKVTFPGGNSSAFLMRPDLIELEQLFEHVLMDSYDNLTPQEWVEVYSKEKDRHKRFCEAAREEEWGIVYLSEPDIVNSLVPTTHYVPFGEAKEWLMDHAQSDEEKNLIDRFDFDSVGAEMSKAWVCSVEGTRAVLNSLKRKYDAFVDKVNKPIKQRKRARLDEDGSGAKVAADD